MPPKLTCKQGFTLTEVLLASAIVMVVVLAVITADMSRFRIEQELRRRAGLIMPEQTRAALATLHIMKHLERADRIVVLNSGSSADVQLRIPLSGTSLATAGCRGEAPDPVVPPMNCLDDPANYRWLEYRLVSGGGPRALQYFSDIAAIAPACGTPAVLANEIRRFSFDFVDLAQLDPPGGSCFTNRNEDCNAINFALEWRAISGPANHWFRGGVTSRAIPYSGINAVWGAAHDSGCGLLPCGVSDPPPPCT